MAPKQSLRMVDDSEFGRRAAQGELQDWPEGEPGPFGALTSKEFTDDFEWAEPPAGGVCTTCHAAGPLQRNPDPDRYVPLTVWVHKSVDLRALAGRDLRIPAFPGSWKKNRNLAANVKLGWFKDCQARDAADALRRAGRAHARAAEDAGGDVEVHPNPEETFEEELLTEGMVLAERNTPAGVSAGITTPPGSPPTEARSRSPPRVGGTIKTVVLKAKPQLPKKAKERGGAPASSSSAPAGAQSSGGAPAGARGGRGGAPEGARRSGGAPEGARGGGGGRGRGASSRGQRIPKAPAGAWDSTGFVVERPLGSAAVRILAVPHSFEGREALEHLGLNPDDSIGCMELNDRPRERLVHRCLGHNGFILFLVAKHPAFVDIAGHLVGLLASEWTQQDGGDVSVFCRHGKHRSVAVGRLAEWCLTDMGLSAECIPLAAAAYHSDCTCGTNPYGECPCIVRQARQYYPPPRR